MRLFHITGLYQLIRIIESGVFRAASSHPLNGDSGLNCFAVGQKATLGQMFEGVGATLYLRWGGPIANVGAIPGPHAPDVLYNMLPWRCFIPVGSKHHLPRIVGFKIHADVLDEHVKDAAPTWWPEKWAAGRRRRAKRDLLLRLRRCIRANGGVLRITGPG